MGAMAESEADRKIRESMPGARKTPGLAIGKTLLPSPDEWAVRNRELTNNLVELINTFAPAATGQALDVGSQWGVMLDNLARRTTPRWWGVDPVVERHLSHDGFELVQGTADDLPFRDAAFDCVVLANVYEHIPPDRRDASLAEMLRVLAPGGVVVGQLPNPHFPIESHSKLPLMGWLPPRAQNVYWRVSPSRRGAGFYSVTVTDLTRRAVAAGYEVDLVRKYNYPPEAAPASIRWLVRGLARPMRIVPWSWQFVLRRPGAAETSGQPSRDIYTGDAAWFGITDDQIPSSGLGSRLFAPIREFRSGSLRLPDVARRTLQTIETELGSDASRELNIDEQILPRLSDLAARERHRGPEWQWIQEATLRLAAQAGLRSAAGAPPSRLTLTEFRTQL
jgi:SAM-dependent methyltransferase